MPDITIAGATFRNVPQIDIPKDGGGTASFIYEDGSKSITENGTHDVSGFAEAVVNVSGGGGATIEALTVTQNGTYTAPSGVDGYSPVTVNVSGGGGSVVIETGTYTPTSNIAKPTISFTNSHNTIPDYISIADAGGTRASSGYNEIMSWNIINNEKMFGTGFPNGTATLYYAMLYGRYRNTSSTSAQWAYMFENPYSPTDTKVSQHLNYYVDKDGFTPYLNSSNRYFIKDVPYKWIAIWLS